MSSDRTCDMIMNLINSINSIAVCLSSTAHIRWPRQAHQKEQNFIVAMDKPFFSIIFNYVITVCFYIVWYYGVFFFLINIHKDWNGLLFFSPFIPIGNYIFGLSVLIYKHGHGMNLTCVSRGYCTWSRPFHLRACRSVCHCVMPMMLMHFDNLRVGGKHKTINSVSSETTTKQTVVKHVLRILCMLVGDDIRYTFSVYRCREWARTMQTFTPSPTTRPIPQP